MSCRREGLAKNTTTNYLNLLKRMIERLKDIDCQKFINGQNSYLGISCRINADLNLKVSHGSDLQSDIFAYLCRFILPAGYNNKCTSLQTNEKIALRSQHKKSVNCPYCTICLQAGNLKNNLQQF